MKDNNTGIKMGIQRCSIEKVWRIIQETEAALTPSNIAERVKLQVSTVRSCLDFLNGMDKISLVTNGKTCLVTKKDGEENATTNN